MVRTHEDGEPSDRASSSDDDTYVCEACGKEFSTEAELEDHVQEQGIVD